MALLLLALITTLIDTRREAVWLWICMQTCCCIFGKLNFAKRTMLNYWLFRFCCWRVIWHQATVLDDCSKQIYLNVLSNLMIMSEYCYIVRANDSANDFFFSFFRGDETLTCVLLSLNVDHCNYLPPSIFESKGKLFFFSWKLFVSFFGFECALKKTSTRAFVAGSL